MKNLDIKRFWLTAKWDVTTNWKSSARIVAGMSIALTILYTIHLMKMFNVAYSPDYIIDQYDTMLVETTTCFLIFMIVGASLIFANMKTKQQRIAFCMLPATNTEKYLVRWLWATAGFMLMFACASVIADVLRMIIWGLAGYGYTGSVVATGLRSVSGLITDMITWFSDSYTDDIAAAKDLRAGYAIFAYVVSLFVLAHSFYLFGGVLFRRNAWLLTTLTGLALLIVLTYTDNFPFLFRGILGYGLWDTEHKITALYMSAGVFAVLSVALYIMSRKLFRRMQVINDKIINV